MPRPAVRAARSSTPLSMLVLLLLCGLLFGGGLLQSGCGGEEGKEGSAANEAAEKDEIGRDGEAASSEETQEGDHAPGDPPSEEGKAGKSPEEGKEEEQPRRTLTFGGSSAGSGEKENGDNSSARARGGGERERRFLAAGGQPVPPEDGVIGPLYIAETAGEEERRVQALSRRFFERLRSGEELTPLLASPEGTGLAERLQREAAETEIGTVRYGKVRLEGGEARQNVRLIGDPGRSAGELLFLLEGGQWHVLGVDIDFSALAEPYTPPEEGREGENVSPLFF